MRVLILLTYLRTSVAIIKRIRTQTIDDLLLLRLYFVENIVILLSDSRFNKAIELEDEIRRT